MSIQIGRGRKRTAVAAMLRMFRKMRSLVFLHCNSHHPEVRTTLLRRHSSRRSENDIVAQSNHHEQLVKDAERQRPYRPDPGHVKVFPWAFVQSFWNWTRDLSHPKTTHMELNPRLLAEKQGKFLYIFSLSHNWLDGARSQNNRPDESYALYL